MRRLRAIVPPFGVEEDVRWVEEDVPEEDERESGGDKIAANADGGGGGGGGGDASTSSTSTSTLEREVLAPGVRRCLPPAPPPGSKPSILAILKRITSTPGGAQLMNIQLPLQLCEPMSEIQRRAEILIPGVRCLDAAASAPPLSLERLLRVTAYAASTYACTVRTSKCVSPVLGETMDALVPELGVRMLSEFVAADKNRARGGYMGSAWVVEGRGWTVSGDDAPLASLRASGLEIQAAFRSRLEFADGDVYDWARATPTAVGLASGRNAVTYDGRVRIAPVLPGDDDDDDGDKAARKPSPPSILAGSPSHVLHAVLDFRAPSLLAALKGGSAVSGGYTGWVERVPASQTRETTPAERERIPGVDFEGDFATHLDVVVSSGSCICCCGSGGSGGGSPGEHASPLANEEGGEKPPNGRKRLWTTPPIIPGCRYGYTRFSAGLNDAAAAGAAAAGPLLLLLPPTDSRRRLDTRLLEAGKYAEAQAQLDRILEIERRREATAAALGEDGKLRAAWFEEVGGGIYRAAAAAAAGAGAGSAGAAGAAAATTSSPLASPAELSAFLVAEAATNSHREFKRAPLRWKFSGEYWRAREEKEWSRSPSIF